MCSALRPYAAITCEVHTLQGMTPPNMLYATRSHCAATWNNLMIFEVAGLVTPEDAREITSALVTHSKAWPNGVAVVALLRPTTPIGSSEVRAEFSRCWNELDDRILHYVVVIEARGVFSQLFKSMIRGWKIAVRNTRMSITDDIESAARALAPHMTGATPRMEAELFHVLSLVRKRFSDTFPRGSYA